MTDKKLDNIPGLPEGNWCIIKKLTYGELNRLMQNSAEIGIKRGEQEATVNIYETRIGMVVYGVKAASFLKEGLSETQKRQAIEDLPIEAGELLFTEINKYNGRSADAEVQKKS